MDETNLIIFIYTHSYQYFLSLFKHIYINQQLMLFSLDKIFLFLAILALPNLYYFA